MPDETAKGDSLELLFSNAQSIKLIFNMHNWSGGVGIQDGSSYVEYNLHEEAGQKEYVVKKIPIESPNVLFTLLSIVVFGMIVLELSKLEKTLFANPDSITFAKKWGVLALNGLTIAIAMGAIGEALYIELWLLMMYVLFCVNRKKAVLDYFWISTLVSYVYRIYYLLHPYILSPLMIFSYLLLLNTFYSFQIGKGQTWSKWVTIILMPVLGLGIVEITGNSDIGNLIPSMLMLNLVLLSLYFAVFSNLIRYKNLGWYIAYLLLFIIAVANHYVIQFKKYALSPADILQIGTAIEVAGDYQYALSDEIVLGALLMILAITLIKNYIPQKPYNKILFIKSKVIGLAAIALMIIWGKSIDFQSEYHIIWNDWDTTETYSQNGFGISFIAALQRMHIDKPPGYSKQAAEEILAEYTGDSEKATLQDKPIIIAIMNESFSDLNDLGSLGDTQDVMWYYNSLDCLEKGRTYVSVRGGGTCNSEFEFLTGNSLEFYSNIYPYTQFDFDHVPTLVSALKSYGYKTIAMHPANPTNYGRQSVYQEMGFDEFYSFDDYAQYDKVFLDRTADIDDYREILKVIEQEDEPLFIFNVTIQNHGGYTLSTLNPKYELVHVDESIAGYEDVQMYLTLINESNKALQYLIEQLQEISKPVILCMFGDHQPGVLSAEFEEKIFLPTENQSALYDVERHYQTPYLIWSNCLNLESQVDIQTSPNYLASKLLQYAGLKETPYFSFLLDMQEEIYASNAFGYLGNDENWHDYSENTKYSEWFEKYRILQYYNMFDAEQ